MTVEQQAHLLEVLQDYRYKSEAKYIKGAEQHGGNLWEKKGLVDMALEEVMDLMFYLYSLKKQIEDKTVYTVNGEDIDK